jgi:hypothetical protein
VDIIYFWCVDYLQIDVKKEIECGNNKTVYLWFKKLQKLSCAILRNETGVKLEIRFTCTD